MTINLIPRTTAGLRRRNPGDLRPTPGVTWQGQIGIDDDFLMFNTDVNGLRAAIINLHTHYVRDHETTVAQLITTYAPAADHNDTGAYIAEVCGALGVAAGDPLVFDRPTATALIRIIIRVEQGCQPYDDATIGAAVDAAFAHFASAIG